MKIKYFSDTDTALVEFSGRKVAETKEINENIYIDLDISGNFSSHDDRACSATSEPTFFVI